MDLRDKELHRQDSERVEELSSRANCKNGMLIFWKALFFSLSISSLVFDQII
jgi:hypothetical protein